MKFDLLTSCLLERHQSSLVVFSPENVLMPFYKVLFPAIGSFELLLFRLFSWFSVIFLNWGLWLAFVASRATDSSPPKEIALSQGTWRLRLWWLVLCTEAFSPQSRAVQEAADSRLRSSRGRGEKHSGAVTLAADWQQAVYTDPPGSVKRLMLRWGLVEREYVLWKFRSLLLCSEASCKAPKVL